MRTSIPEASIIRDGAWAHLGISVRRDLIRKHPSNIFECVNKRRFGAAPSKQLSAIQSIWEIFMFVKENWKDCPLNTMLDLRMLFVYSLPRKTLTFVLMLWLWLGYFYCDKGRVDRFRFYQFDELECWAYKRWVWWKWIGVSHAKRG